MTAKLILRILIAVIAGITLCPGADGQGIDSLFLRKQIDKLLRYESPVDSLATPGFLVGIVDGTSTEIFAYGSRSFADTGRPAANDQFEIGSLTKLFTASVLAEMAASGVLSLYEPAGGFLPLKDRTIADLLIHFSGLPRAPNMISAPPTAETRFDLTCDELRAMLEQIALPSEKTFSYSHIGYALLGEVVEARTGLDYQTSLSNFLGSIGVPSNGQRPDTGLIPGHDMAGVAVAQRDYGCFFSSEGMCLSLNDLLRFCKYSLESVPDLIWEYERRPAFNKFTGITLGWNIYYPNRRRKVFMHTGTTEGYSAFIGMVRETHTAVVVLANSAAGTRDLGLNVLRTLNNNWKR